MRFEETGDISYPYLVTFEGDDEIDTVKAVFREEMFRHAQKGNTSSISDYDLKMADWDGKMNILPTRLISLESMVQRLEEFHDMTDDAIVEISHDYGVAPFLNDDIILRRRMGMHALELANQIKTEAAKSLRKIDFESLDLDAEFSSLMDDDHPPLQ